MEIWALIFRPLFKKRKKPYARLSDIGSCIELAKNMSFNIRELAIAFVKKHVSCFEDIS